MRAGGSAAPIRSTLRPRSPSLVLLAVGTGMVVLADPWRAAAEGRTGTQVGGQLPVSTIGLPEALVTRYYRARGARPQAIRLQPAPAAQRSSATLRRS